MNYVDAGAGNTSEEEIKQIYLVTVSGESVKLALPKLS